MPGLIRMTTGFAWLPAGTDMIASCTDLNWPLPSRATVMLICSFRWIAPVDVPADLAETQRTTEIAQRMIVLFISEQLVQPEGLKESSRRSERSGDLRLTIKYRFIPWRGAKNCLPNISH